MRSIIIQLNSDIITRTCLKKGVEINFVQTLSKSTHLTLSRQTFNYTKAWKCNFGDEFGDHLWNHLRNYLWNCTSGVISEMISEMISEVISEIFSKIISEIALPSFRTITPSVGEDESISRLYWAWHNISEYNFPYHFTKENIFPRAWLLLAMMSHVLK